MLVTVEEIAKATETNINLKRIKVSLESGKQLAARGCFNIQQTAYNLQQDVIICNQ